MRRARRGLVALPLQHVKLALQIGCPRSQPLLQVCHAIRALLIRADARGHLVCREAMRGETGVAGTVCGEIEGP